MSARARVLVREVLRVVEETMHFRVEDGPRAAPSHRATRARAEAAVDHWLRMWKVEPVLTKREAKALLVAAGEVLCGEFDAGPGWSETDLVNARGKVRLVTEREEHVGGRGRYTRRGGK